MGMGERGEMSEGAAGLGVYLMAGKGGRVGL